jgi:hypothetical protein
MDVRGLHDGGSGLGGSGLLPFLPVPPPVAGLLWPIYRPVTVLLSRTLNFLRERLKRKILLRQAGAKSAGFGLFSCLNRWNQGLSSWEERS